VGVGPKGEDLASGFTLPRSLKLLIEGRVNVCDTFKDVFPNLRFGSFLALYFGHFLGSCPYLRMGRLGPLRVRALVEVR
jgi:hypothetical protein